MLDLGRPVIPANRKKNLESVDLGAAIGSSNELTTADAGSPPEWDTIPLEYLL